MQVCEGRNRRSRRGRERPRAAVAAGVLAAGLLLAAGAWGGGADGPAASGAPGDTHAHTGQRPR